MLKLVPIPKTLTLALCNARVSFVILSFKKKEINKRGGKPPTSKKSDFFGLTEISGRKNGREQKKSAEPKFRPSLRATLKDF